MGVRTQDGGQVQGNGRGEGANCQNFFRKRRWAGPEPGLRRGWGESPGPAGYGATDIPWVPARGPVASQTMLLSCRGQRENLNLGHRKELQAQERHRGPDEKRSQDVLWAPGPSCKHFRGPESVDKGGKHRVSSAETVKFKTIFC